MTAVKLHRSQETARISDKSLDKLRKLEERRAEDARIARSEAPTHLTTASKVCTATLIETEAKESSFTRTADDPTLNMRQMREARWDDPARLFVETLMPKRQKFQAPPNRFDILPGVHWDGVDRSNGFERKLFQKKAQEEAVKELRYQHDYGNL